MKKISFTLLLILITSIGFSQIKHTKFSTVIKFDQFNPAPYFYNTSVSEIKNNSGYFLSNFYDNQAYGFNPSLVKLDVDGNILMDTIYDFMPNNSGGFSGIVNSTTSLTSHAVLYRTGSIEATGNVVGPYLLKYDLNGNLLWHYGFTNDSLDLETDKLIPTQDGGYLILGSMYDWMFSNYPESGFVIKLDAAGVLQWHKMYANKDTMTISFNDGIQTKDGGYFFVGEATNFQGGSRLLDQWDRLVTMVRTDNAGNTIWNKGITLDAPIDNSNGFYDISCGMINDSNAFVSFSAYDSSATAGHDKFAITSVNINTGLKNWTNYYSLPVGEYMSVRKAVADGKGNIIVSGSDYNNSTGMLFQIDELGNLINTKRFTFSTHANFPYETKPTLDGGIIHVSEISQNEVLIVKTDGDLDPSCPDIDSTYLMLTATMNNDTSYLNFVDTTFTVNGLYSTQFTAGSPVNSVSDDSLICSCSNIITGTVYDGGNPAANAKVFLFKKGFVPKPWRAVDSTTTDGLGAYTFNYVATDSFLVKVNPDPILQPNAISSYHKEVGFCYKWDSAGVFHVHCDSLSIVKDVDLINIVPLTGNSSLNGYVFENSGGFSKQQPGDPIPGIDITVEQSPGGPVGVSSTNGVGYYDLMNLNNSATYIVSIDYPGLPNDSVYTMVINLSDTIMDSLNFYVDTTGIYILDEDLGVGVNVVHNEELEIKLFPNPSVGNFSLSVYGTKSEMIELDLTNKVGQHLYSKSQNIYKGENKIVISAQELPAGIYFLKIRHGNNFYLKKLIKL